MNSDAVRLSVLAAEQISEMELHLDLYGQVEHCSLTHHKQPVESAPCEGISCTLGSALHYRSLSLTQGTHSSPGKERQYGPWDEMWTSLDHLPYDLQVNR